MWFIYHSRVFDSIDYKNQIYRRQVKTSLDFAVVKPYETVWDRFTGEWFMDTKEQIIKNILTPQAQSSECNLPVPKRPLNKMIW